MAETKKEISRFLLDPFLWVVVGLSIYGYYLFRLSLTPEWIYINDAAAHLSLYNFQYSGLARGEYPIWNPLNRSGEPIYFFQAFTMAHPLSNLVILISLLFGVKNIVFSLSVYFFLFTTLYVVGVYLLVLVLTKNCFAATFGALITLASPPVLLIPTSEIYMQLIFSIPWVLYSLIQYHRTIKFRYLAIVVLSFCSAIYSYQLTYAFSFLIVVFFSWLIFYWKTISIQIFTKIPNWHIGIITFLALLIIAPIIQIALITINGDFLPSASRINHSTLAVTEGLNVKFDFLFDRLPEFFFGRENLLAVIFTGAFWARTANELNGAWSVLRYFLGPIVLPFLGIAVFYRSRIVLCVILAILLIATQAGGYFPGNLIYKLPFFYQMKYAYLLNTFLVFSLIILSSLGFDHFLKNKNHLSERILVWFACFLILGCVFLSIFLPSRNYSNSALALTSFTMVVFISLILFRQKITQAVLVNFFFAMIVSSTIFFQYLIKSHHPHLNGGITKNMDILKLKNKEDHSLHFLMERPDEIRIWDRQGKSGASGDIDEYYSFFDLFDNSYKVSLKKKGLGSYPITKDYFTFLSLPGHDELLKKKFHFFNHAIPLSLSDYLKKIKDQPKLINTLLKNKIGIVVDPEDFQSPVYLQDDALDNLENIKEENLTNDFDVKVIQYNANSVRLLVKTERAGLLIYADTWDKGWQAKNNETPTPVLRVFKTLKGIELVPGTHEIEFYFKNWILVSFMIMNGVFFVLLFITIGKFLLSIRTVSNS